MWVFGCWDVGNEALFFAVEVDEHKGGENKDWNDSVATECRFWSEIGDKQAWKGFRVDGSIFD